MLLNETDESITNKISCTIIKFKNVQLIFLCMYYIFFTYFLYIFFSYLLPLKSSKTKRKTPVIKRTCNPVWDYQMTYELDYEDLADFGIEFTVS